MIRSASQLKALAHNLSKGVRTDAQCPIISDAA
jgi:hypothetical protein